MAAKKATEIKITEFKELNLLKAFASQGVIKKYKGYLKEHTVLSETWFLVGEYEKYFKQYPDREEIAFDVFSSWFSTSHAAWKEDKLKYYLAIIANVEKASDEDAVNNLLHHFSRLDVACRIRDTSERYISGSVPDLQSAIKELLEEHARNESVYSELAGEDELFLPIGAKHVIESLLGKGSGFKWSIKILNESFGPMHLGDFGAIIARPNGGKTTMLVQESLNFLLQMEPEAKCLIFNNEEKGQKLQAYAYKNLLKQPLSWMALHAEKADKDFEDKLGGRKFYVKDDSSMSIWNAEKIIERVRPKIVAFNLLGKMKGYEKDGELERLIKLYRWGREIAKRYNMIVLNAHQADVSAEGEKYMTQQQIFGSKTEVQGELDVLLAIGKTHDPASRGKRYLSSCKNKQPETLGMESALREGPLGEVEFDGDISTFR